jgi:hypothetical protein
VLKANIIAVKVDKSCKESGRRKASRVARIISIERGRARRAATVFPGCKRHKFTIPSLVDRTKVDERKDTSMPAFIRKKRTAER